MPHRIELAAVAKKFDLIISEHHNGTIILIFPRIDNITTLLITSDDGITWTPEASNGVQSLWGGHICLVGQPLNLEIMEMCEASHIQYSLVARMLEVAEYLDKLNTGKIYS
jgi:hypothetical protein